MLWWRARAGPNLVLTRISDGFTPRNYFRKPQTEIYSQANALELESKQGISYSG